jgi:hypothetical protein
MSQQQQQDGSSLLTHGFANTSTPHFAAHLRLTPGLKQELLEARASGKPVTIRFREGGVRSGCRYLPSAAVPV